MRSSLDLEEKMILEIIFIGIIGIFYFNTFQWLFVSWMNNNYYSHGFLVPIISIYIIWSMKNELLNTERKQSQTGLIFFISGIILFMIANLYVIRFLSGISLVITIFGTIFYLYGWEFVNKIKFPIFFLLLSIPIPFADILVPTMQTISVISASNLANLIGLPVYREGLMLRLPESTFQVAAECSGINSIISLITISIIFAFILEGNIFKKLTIVISSIPLAMTGNIIRITTVLIVGYKYGEDFALRYFHEFSSFVLFIIALIGLFIVGRCFGRLKFKKIF